MTLSYMIPYWFKFLIYYVTEAMLILSFFNLFSFKNKSFVVKTLPIWGLVLIYTTFMSLKLDLPFVMGIDNFLQIRFHLMLSNLTDILFTTLLTLVILYRGQAKLSIMQQLFWVSTVNFIVIAVTFVYKVILNYRFEFLAANPGMYGVGIPDKILYDFEPIVMSVLLLFAFLFTKKVIRPSFIYETRPNNKILVYLVGISLLSVWILIYLAKNIGVPFYLSRYAIVAVIVAVIIINNLIWLIYKEQEIHYQERTEIEIEKVLFESKVQEFERMRQQIQEMEKFRHDLKNQYIMLYSLLENQELEQAVETLKEKIETVDSMDTFYTNHLFINSFLNIKNKEANAQGIKLQAKVFLPEKLTISPDILGVVIGNLLDNSFSAVGRNHYLSNEVDCTIKVLNGNLLIEVRNQFDQSEVKERAKRQEKGYGIKNIRRTVAQHNGLYKQWTEKDIFNTSIVFFNIYE